MTLPAEAFSSRKIIIRSKAITGDAGRKENIWKAFHACIEYRKSRTVRNRVALNTHLKPELNVRNWALSSTPFPHAPPFPIHLSPLSLS